MKRLILFVVVITIGTYINSYAQVPTKVLSKNEAFEKYPKFEISQKNSRIIKLPKFDIASFLEADEAIKGLDVPFRFGKGFDVDYSLQDGYWENTTDGRVWSLVVESDGAYSINFIFNELFLPPKGELYIYNDDGSMVYGPVTNKQNLTKGLFLTDLVQGDKVTLHIFEPSNFKEKTRLRINRIVHAYKNMYSGYSTGPGTAEACHNNIDCYPNWGDESDGIALILLSSGTEWCTGGMVNNTANDYTPYILTANHCLDGSQASWLFKFGFRYNDCGGMNYSATTYNGSVLTSLWADTDFALLEMNESPVGNDNIAYLGWDNRDNTPTSGIGIHHPSGDYMKISFENNSFSTSTWGPGGLTDGHWLINFDDGVVEHGSSGSPIFNQDGRIVGQLHGNSNYNEAEDYCDQPRAEYGRFDFSWNGNNTNATQLAHWLDPNSTGAATTNLLRSPSLTVPDVICYSGTTVSIQNAPNVTIIWGGTNVSYPYGNTGTSVTVRASSSSTSNNGTVTASFTVNNIPYTITHPVWVGSPSFTWDYVNSDTELSPFEYGFAYPVYAVDEEAMGLIFVSTDWSYTGPLTSIAGNLQLGKYRAGRDLGAGSIRYEVANTCGSTWHELYYEVVDNWYLSVSPNPATNEATLTIESVRSEAIDISTEWDLEIYDQMQILKTKKVKLKGNQYKINTSGWQGGMYFVRIKFKDKILSGKFLVNR